MQYQMQADSDSSAQRRQLIEGFCLSVEDKGYTPTTIADIVRSARVSKRTFYEQFTTKEDCFLAAYRVLSDETMQAVAAAVEPTQPWERQIEVAVRAYLSVLDARPILARTFLLEILAAGPGALELRRQVLQEFAQLTRGFVELARRRRPELRRLTATMAMAIVGGINELVLLKVEKAGRIADLADSAVELLRAVVAPPSELKSAAALPLTAKTTRKKERARTPSKRAL
jgi:AcrR family transcriptional regulator